MYSRASKIVDARFDRPTAMRGYVELTSHDWIDHFKEGFKVSKIKSSFDEAEFELSGIDASIANALRRIMISEVPLMAIEHVFVKQNTSIIQDEVLCHRLGLVPIKVDPALFNDAPAEGVGATSLDTIVFRMEVTYPMSKADPDKDYMAVYSGALEWIPQGDQASRFTGDNVIKPVLDDILLAKLKPGQSIELECHAVKNIGREHAKWSPVCTASYRMLPVVEITKEIVGEAAVEMKKKCPMNVFDIEDSGSLVAAREKNCTVCRECIREPQWRDHIKLLRDRNHFIFKVESTGSISAEQIFIRAVRKLASKAKAIKESLAGIVE